MREWKTSRLKIFYSLITQFHKALFYMPKNKQGFKITKIELSEISTQWVGPFDFRNKIYLTVAKSNLFSRKPYFSNNHYEIA